MHIFEGQAYIEVCRKHLQIRHLSRKPLSKKSTWKVLFCIISTLCDAQNYIWKI